MALRQRLEIRQGQSLVMTPQLQQAIKLLQLSNIELSAYVEQQLERNPLLEEVNEDGEPDQLPSPKDAEYPPIPETENARSSDEENAPPGLQLTDDAAPPSTSSDLDTDYENVYADESIADKTATPALLSDMDNTFPKQVTKGQGTFDSTNSFETSLTKEPTLAEHLTEQLMLSMQDMPRRMIGIYLIDQVDDAGYLREDIASIAERTGARLEEVETVLGILQSFDPAGVCARSPQECLAIQLARKGLLDPVMQRFLDNIELFAKRNFARLMKICEIDQEDLQSLIDDVRACDPKPGHAFGAVPIHPVVPDLFIRPGPGGGWAIELNNETLPRVLVNQAYYTEISQKALNEESRTFITECLNDANWLVKSLDQRARTILKVGAEIVRQQDAFFAHGISHLKPLNLKTVAEAISMHESTVSRVTANKYAQTPLGIFELKYFFTASIASTSGGDAHSAEAVRHRIKALIDNESPDTVLSDDKIVNLLKGDGIDIARRTIAKYREAMHIPSSVQRRREKKHLPQLGDV